MAIGTGDGPPDLEAGLRLAARYPFIYATVGVHPHDASKATRRLSTRLRELAAHPKVVAIGEIGLDYHYDFSPRDVQRAVFSRQLEHRGRGAASRSSIHTREAWEDTMAIAARATGAAPASCTVSPAMPRKRGRRWTSASTCFGGVLTFPKAEAVREAARITPDDRLLIETDCPYLAPVPHRGKRNEPAFVVETARRLAEVRGPDGRGDRRADHAQLRAAVFAGRDSERVNWVTSMNLGKLGQASRAREIFDLVQDDLEQVEKKIAAESVASVDAVTAIGQYLQSSGGKRLRPALLLLSAKLVGARQRRTQRHPAGRGGGDDPRRHAGARRRHRRRRNAPRPPLQPTSSGAITPACWRATGCTCRPSRSRCASAISRFSTC